MREAKTHVPHLLDAAHAGAAITLARGARSWARLMPLEPPRPRPVPGVLVGRLCLPPPEALLEPLPEQELAALACPLP